jgi:AraC-like DNA-binding protein
LRGDEPAHLALLQRGAFTYHLGRRAFVGDPCMALLHWPKLEYRVGHPGDAGDDVTIVQLSDALADELFGRRRRDQPEIPLAPRTQLLHARVQASRADGVAAAGLDAEELALELLAAVASAQDLGERRMRGPSRTTTRARELLAARFADDLRIDALATEAGCSAFHLMRTFRAETGRSLRAYRRELRVAAALPRLADGERDLARLALELGFAHHSHFSASFRRVLGRSPAVVRDELAAARKRTFVTAGTALSNPSSRA